MRKTLGLIYEHAYWLDLIFAVLGLFLGHPAIVAFSMGLFIQGALSREIQQSFDIKKVVINPKLSPNLYRQDARAKESGEIVNLLFHTLLGESSLTILEPELILYSSFKEFEKDYQLIYE